MMKQTHQKLTVDFRAALILTERFSVFQRKLYLQQAAVVSDSTLHVQQQADIYSDYIVN